MDKYEYLTGENLGYKPYIIQRAKFEYFPLGEAFNKVFRKDDKNKKIIKYSNGLFCSSVHNFNKYSVPKDLLKLNGVKSQNENTRKKITVLKNASLLYYELIDMCKKEHEQVSENKDENWKKKHDYKNLKDFSYQVDEVKKDKAEKEKEDEDEDETDQELPPWIKVSKNRFSGIKDVITRSNESRLMTSIGKRKITLKNSEKTYSVKKLIKKARRMYNSIADDANKLNRLGLTEPRKKMLPIFKQLQEIFMGSKADAEVDDEVDDEKDNDMDYKTDGQPSTTDMPNF